MSNVKLFKNTSLYTLGNILPKAIAFILLPIYTKYMTAAEYGIVNSMQALSTVLALIFTLAVDRAVYRLYFDYKTEEEKREYMGTIAIALLVISLVALILLLVFRDLVEMVYTQINFYPFYFLSILASFFSVFTLVPNIYFQVNEKAGKFILLTLLQFFVNTGFIIWYVIIEREGALGMLKGSVYASAVTLPLFIIITARVIKFKFNSFMFKESVKFSLPQIPHLMSAWILDLSDRIFIQRYVSFEEVGIYSLGYKIAALVLIFTSGFYQAYNPFYFKLANSQQQDEAKKTLYEYNHIFMTVIILLTFALSFFSKEIILFLFSKDFTQSLSIVPLITVAYLFSETSGIFNLSIYQSKKSVHIMIFSLGSALVNLIMNYLLIPKYGAVGAGYSTIIAFAFFFAVKYLYTRKCYYIPVKWGNLIPLVLGLVIIFALFQFLINTSLMLTFVLKTITFAAVVFFIFRTYFSQFLSILRTKPASTT